MSSDANSPVAGNAKHRLPRWNEWCAAFPYAVLQDQIARLEDDAAKSALRAQHRNLRRFRARYELAASFRGILVDGFEARTVKGYAAAVRLSLVYNAADVLGDAIKDSVRNWNVENKAVANEFCCWLDHAVKLPNDTPLNKALASIGATNRLQSEICEVAERKSCNIRPIAELFRHSMSHGKLTPRIFNSQAGPSAEIQDHVSDYLLDATEKKFGDFLDKALESK